MSPSPVGVDRDASLDVRTSPVGAALLPGQRWVCLGREVAGRLSFDDGGQGKEASGL